MPNFLRPIFLILFIMLFTACVAKNGPQGSGAGPSGSVNPTKALNISPPAFNEDTESIITLSYSDADGNLASSCSTNTLSNISLIRSCSCSAGVCTVGVKGNSNYNGGASFRYQVTANGVTSSNGVASLTITAVNDAPTMDAIAAQSTNKNAVKVVSFKIADVDSTLTCANSVTVTSSNTTLIPLANIVLAGTVPNCTATITPAYNLSGTSDIQLTVTDTLLTAARTFTLTVVNYNYPPTISFISNVTTLEDTSTSVNFVIDDVDSATAMVCSSANLSVYTSSNGTLIPGVNGADVVFSGTYPNCTATFMPAPNQNGSSNIVIRATDNGSGIPAAQIGDSNAFKITVTAVDDAPVANNFSPAAFNEDTQSIITLSYTDVENDKATVCTITNPTNVTVTQACACALGVCTVGVTGTTNYNGAASFNFSVLANGATSNTALASLTITGVDDPPVAQALTPAAMTEDVQSIITLSYTDIENDKATICALTNLTNVTVTQACACDGAGVCTVGVTGTSNYNGAASFKYTVTANNAISNSALATLTIDAVNDPPVAAAITPAAFNEDTQSIITLSYTDVENDKATSCAIINPTNVTVTQACACDGGGICTVGVTGVLNFNGAASFNYTVNAAGADSNSALATLSITPVDDPPVASDFSPAAFDEDMQSIITLAYVDVDNDKAISCTITNPSNVTITQACSCALGVCTVGVTGTSNYSGAGSFNFSVTANGVTSNTALASLTINPVDDPPVAAPLTPAAFNEDTQSVITLSYTDVENDKATTCALTNLTNISVTQACACDGAGVCTVGVTGLVNYNGAASFKYTVTANSAVSNSATATLSITAVDDPPVAAALTPAAFNEDTQSVITLSYTDVENDLATTCALTNLTNVTVTQACACASGICTVGVTGTANYFGAASFNYNVTANGAASNSALATLTIAPVDDPPVAVAITPAAFNEDTQSIITLSYTDVENDLATACTITAPTHVSVTQACACDGAGVCTVGITGLSNYNGAASFNYTVTANSAISNSVAATLSITAVDDAPVAAAITPASFNEDTAATITLSYTDVESDKATACTISNPTNITVTTACSCDAGGVCTVGVTGLVNYNGAASFNYTVTANSKTSNAALATLSITAVDDAPTVADVTLLDLIYEDVESGTLTLNYADVDGDRAAADGCTISNLNHVTVTQACACDVILGTCSLKVKGDANYFGAASFDYAIKTTTLTSTAKTASLSIIAVDDPPVAAAISPAAFNEDTTSIITLSYTDQESDLATACALTNLTNVTITQACACDGSGVCTVGVKGLANYFGASSFKYTVTANNAASNSATATLSITSVDDPPVAQAISPAAFNEDTQSVITLLYTDVENDLATACTITNPTNVTVTQACTCASGICTVGVTGTTNYNGAASFDYTVTANNATSNSSHATLVISPVDDAPVAAAITPVAFNEDTQSIITLSYTDTESDKATSCTVSSPTHISITQACACDGSGICTVGVTGTANYNGAASFAYTVTANGAISNLATATLSITAVDDAPVAAAIAPAAFNEDTESVITLSYSDVESDKATACTISNPVNVTETTGCSCDAAGVCTVGITGTANYNGAASFNYTVTANSATSNAALATLSITAVDDAPVAAAITPAAFNEDTQSIITLSYTDTESDKATVCSISNLTNVTITQNCSCNASGVCTVGVTGTANYNGSASFKYTVTANGLTSNSVTASLTINAVNDAPVALAIAPAAFNEDTQSVITLSYTDVESDAATACTITSPVNVTVSQTCACASGVCTVGVTGTANYNGAASFNYTVTANGATSNSALASLTINAVDDAPTVADVTLLDIILEDVESGSITLYYTDVDGDRAAADGCTISNLSHVTVTQACTCDVILGTCSVKVKGTANYNGTASFDYQVTTNSLTSTAKTATMTITAVDDPPVAAALTPTAFNEDTQSVITLSYTDVENDSATSCALSNLTNVTVTQACACASGICTVGVTGTSNYNGGASFKYTVTANGATSNSALATLTINAVDDAPTVADVTLLDLIYEDIQSDTITLNYTDVDGDRAAADGCTISNLSHVTVTQACACDYLLGTCSLKVTGDANYNGAASFKYAIKTNALTSVAKTVSMSIIAVDDPPVAVAITPAAFNEDTQSVITLSYTDVENDSATSCTLSNLSNVTETQACACSSGTCTVGVTGTSNYNGAASFNYTVTANGATSNSASATLSITAVDDAPVAVAITPAAFNEDTQSIITLSYTDVENDLANACTISNLSNVTVTQACACASGVCTVGVTGTSNYNGSASFNYTVTANTKTSNSASASLTINAVDDAPVAAAITPAAFNEDTQSVITLSYTDVESDKATSCTLSNLTNVTITQACSCNGSGVCTVGVTGTSNYNGAASFNYTVTANSATSNSASATLTINAVDDPPVITPSGALPIANQTIDEDSSTSALTFTVSDVDSPVACSDVVGTSSDTSKILNAGIVIGGGAGTSCTVTVTPVANANGNGTVITLTLGVTTSTFTVNLTPVPDIAGSLTVNSNLTGVASAYLNADTYSTRKLNFNSNISVDEAVSTLEVCLGTTASGCETVGWTSVANGAGDNKYTTSGSAPNIAIAGNYKFSTSSAAFVLSHSCTVGTTTNYYFSVRVTNASGKKAIVNSEAWSFWDPSCLGNSVLAQWLDASETSTISGTSVATWSDKSGNNRDVSQVIGGNKPTYSATGLSGSLPGVTFNGTSTSLTRSSFVYAQGAASIFAAVKASGTASEKYIFSEGRSNTTTNYYAPLMNSNNDTVTGNIVDDSTAINLNSPTSDTALFDANVNIVMAKDTGSSFTTYSNGVIQTQAATTYTRGTSTIDTYSLGAKYSSGTASGWFAGTLSEFIIINGALSAGDREKVEGYMAHKWGASANLTGGHTYKSHPPGN